MSYQGEQLKLFQPSPTRFQHRLRRGSWETDALRDERLGVALSGLGEDAFPVVGEMGFDKQGKQSVDGER